MYQTIFGLLMAALTGLAFYLVARNRYKCPHCGRVVKWSDECCAHCGGDMKFQHRVGPPQRRMKPVLGARISGTSPPSRKRSSSRTQPDANAPRRS